ncbi:MAG: hypothetical protein CVV44_22760 [Spirochaetae bacterium HGW-Spirochaetae-1]|nr:MAG: hypothetical protein CVV44_22760 [Spirochaetae bacterium HGW-Spirochaetae-1]
MKKKTISSILISTIIIAAAALFTNCFNDDMAIVTIRLERNDLAAFKQEKTKPLIDRILEIFSSPAHAGGWEDIRDNLSYTVTGPDMETIPLTPIASGTTQFSIEVPAGLNRHFTVTAYNSTWGYDVWGGQATVSLTAGQEANVTIKMIPKTAIYSASGSTELTVTWGIIGGQYNFSRYILYRSTNINGPYNEITTISTYSTGFYYDYDVTYGTTYYYKIAIESDADGLGVLSDAVSGMPN